MKHAIAILVLLVMAGCLDESAWVEREQPGKPIAAQDTEEYRALPPQWQAVVDKADPSESIPLLSAVVVVANSGAAVQFGWTPADTTGGHSIATSYRVHLSYTVKDTTTWVLVGTGKDSISLQVQGIDAVRLTGPWSDVSDTLITERTSQ